MQTFVTAAKSLNIQTILGAGGAIAKELASELQKYTTRVRLVSRNPKKINDSDELFPADLTDGKLVDSAVKGSEVVYLVAGLQYKIKVWREQWPKIMQNVINACEHYNSKLVFFDNIYMYDRNSLSDITEQNPVMPSSQKGKVRAHLADMIFDEIRKGKLTAMIVRAADFYGPGVNTSVVMETVYKNLQKGKKANWLGNADKVHSLTYTPDAARATALLGNTTDAYNQVWHLPTDEQRITGKQWVELFAKNMNVPPKYMAVPTGLVKFMGLFNPMMKELGEMMYQFDRDYFFDSTKFNRRFPDFRITPYAEGVRNIEQETRNIE